MEDAIFRALGERSNSIAALGAAQKVWRGALANNIPKLTGELSVDMRGTPAFLEEP